MPDRRASQIRPIYRNHRPPIALDHLEPRTLFASVAPGFADLPVVTGLSDPTAMEFSPDGRFLFAAQQTGQLRIINLSTNTLLPTPFVSLTVDSTLERGLLGIAFDPNYASNHFVYLYYTATIPTIHNRISRFTADASGTAAVPGSELPLFDLPTLTATNHNGGSLHFGPDGKLYAGVGENAQPPLAQSLSSPLGKLLRLNPDGSIPSDNPLLAQATGQAQAAFAYGLRNPFTFAFQPGTGRLFINDVGQDTFEEIDDGLPAANYGWPTSEGPTSDPAFTAPLFFYAHGHSDTTGDAVTGGTFYDPPVSAANRFPDAFTDSYFFSDLTSGWIRRLDPAGGYHNADPSPFATGISVPVDLDVGPDGSLYYLFRGAGDNTGGVSRIAPTSPSVPPPPPPPTSAAPVPTITSPKSTTLFRAGQRINFTGQATDPEDGKLKPSSLTWQVNLIENNQSMVVLPATPNLKHGHFLIPRTGPLSATTPDATYQITLTATDSAGQPASTTLTLHPRTMTLTIQSLPVPGLSLTLDNQPFTTPLTFTTIPGTLHTLTAPEDQTLDGIAYHFLRWSNTRRATQDFSTPARDKTIMAIYRAVP